MDANSNHIELKLKFLIKGDYPIIGNNEISIDKNEIKKFIKSYCEETFEGIKVKESFNRWWLFNCVLASSHVFLIFTPTIYYSKKILSNSKNKFYSNLITNSFKLFGFYFIYYVIKSVYDISFQIHNLNIIDLKLREIDDYNNFKKNARIEFLNCKI